MRQMHFVVVCDLLEELDRVDDNQKGALAERRKLLEIWWRSTRDVVELRSTQRPSKERLG